MLLPNPPTSGTTTVMDGGSFSCQRTDSASLHRVHHRGHGAYTWPPTIRSAEPSKALTSTKCCPQPEVERGTSKVLQNGTGSRPHLQGAVHPEPKADAPM